MATNVRIQVYINGELIREQALPLNAAVRAPLLGIEISKDARNPTDLMVVVEELGEDR